MASLDNLLTVSAGREQQWSVSVGYTYVPTYHCFYSNVCKLRTFSVLHNLRNSATVATVLRSSTLMMVCTYCVRLLVLVSRYGLQLRCDE